MSDKNENSNGKFIFKLMFLYFILVPAYIILPLPKKLKRYTADVFEPSTKTLIESQRGYTPETYENTLESFKKAIELNLDSVSCDVWYTKDKIPVLVRGGEWGELDNYFGTSEQVTQLTYEQVSKLKSNKGNFKITKLVDVIELCKNKIFLNIIIRDFRVEVIFPLISEMFEKYDLFEQAMISSEQLGYHFRINEYNNFYEHDNKIAFGFMFEKDAYHRYEFEKHGHVFSVHWTKVTKELVDKAHENMMAIQAWFDKEENESEEIYNVLFKLGVDVIGSFKALKAQMARDNYFKSR